LTSVTSCIPPPPGPPLPGPPLGWPEVDDEGEADVAGVLGLHPDSTRMAAVARLAGTEIFLSTMWKLLEVGVARG
jgi:hypothetical protein